MRARALFAALSLALTTAHSARANYALFDSPTDTISLNGNTTLGVGATYEAWIQPKGPGGLIFSEWRITQEDKRLDTRDSTLTAYSYDINRSSGSFAVPVSYTTSQWHHVAYVFAGNQERLYLDGQQIGLRGASGNIDDDPISIASIGATVRENFSASFIGLIDSVRVSSNARYAGETFALPARDFEPDIYTQLLFNFDEPEGSPTVTDLGTNAMTGFLGAGFSGATAPTIIGTELPLGDTDLDGFVGIGDLNIVLGKWNQAAAPGDPADPSSDGFVGIEDINLVLGNWNTGTPPNGAADIPEPTTLALLGLGVLAVSRRR
jgi:hypothetical protein